MIEYIEREHAFHAVAHDNSFELKIESYVPYLATAIHDGHQLRKELWDNCTHDHYERWYEESPETYEVIRDLPMTIRIRDSRFEYDVNRDVNSAVYDRAWGRELWHEPLSADDVALSLRKRRAFYDVILALMLKLEDLFPAVVVYDLQSYNKNRWDRKVPTWNIGTALADSVKHKDAIQLWQDCLGRMRMPNGIKSDCAINDVFQGKGHFAKYLTSNTDHTLVLSTELAKVYCDEDSWEIYPDIVAAIKDQFTYYVRSHAHRFFDGYTA